MTPNGASVLLECSTVLWVLMADGASNCRIVRNELDTMCAFACSRD